VSWWERGAAGAAAAIALSGCWRAPGGNPNRNGHNGLEDGLSDEAMSTMTEAWQAPGNESSPVIVGDRVYSVGPQMRAVDVSTGAVAWQVPDAPTWESFEVLFEDNKLLVNSGSRRLGSRPAGTTATPAIGSAGPVCRRAMWRPSAVRRLSCRRSRAVPIPWACTP
jgi:hypothetical protein